LINFVQKWETKYPSLKSFKSQRNIAYFTYLDFPAEIQRITTNRQKTIGQRATFSS
jgi:hypothetical protein